MTLSISTQSEGSFEKLWKKIFCCEVRGLNGTAQKRRRLKEGVRKNTICRASLNVKAFKVNSLSHDLHGREGAFLHCISGQKFKFLVLLTLPLVLLALKGNEAMIGN